MGQKIEFLNLGVQPIANNYLKNSHADEYLYELRIQYDTDTHLVSLADDVPKDLLFHGEYAYESSKSYPMIQHFKESADAARHFIHDNEKVLEIGSNDGIFITNFSREQSVAVEPCSNFAKVTNDKGYKTYSEFWNTELARKIKQNDGPMSVIFSANCLSHIPDIHETFAAISIMLADDGVLIMEDPSLLQVISNCSYDQFYDEHFYVFSATALDNILAEHGLGISKIEHLPVHGGSVRYYITKNIDRTQSILEFKNMEKFFKLDSLDTYKLFAESVSLSKQLLKDLLIKIRAENNKIISYGATGKSNVVFNYCKIGTELIDYITDTTKFKQDKYSPGMHIPIISPEEGFNDSVDYAFLGAWNFIDAIVAKE